MSLRSVNIQRKPQRAQSCVGRSASPAKVGLLCRGGELSLIGRECLHQTQCGTAAAQRQSLVKAQVAHRIPGAGTCDQMRSAGSTEILGELGKVGRVL